ncbi:NAD(+) diphosphatase [uncultured Sphingomonas sp.]|uniref:NAD(+) diphosphatase n=1 Tax=uncultured Sphingomonas sp. TaxID=158754 RepID=UPI0035C994F6
MIQPGFTGGTLDRADRLRHDADGLAAALADPRARLLAMRPGWEPALEEDDRLGWTGLDGAPDGADLLLLGLEADGSARVVALTGAEGGSPYRSPALMAALARLRPGEAAIYAAARSLLHWHSRNGYCANCGHATAMFRAGWGRKCPNCTAEHFPRTDPVVIMIAEHDGRALLGRQPSWPPGRYSALAGFLEPGESIEEAVAREVGEETGVRVSGVRYVASQPWPFPHSQLMIACVAQAEDDAITLDVHELEDAIWVPRDAVRRVLAGGEGPFIAPPPYAIAWTLLSEWAGG